MIHAPDANVLISERQPSILSKIKTKKVNIKEMNRGQQINNLSITISDMQKFVKKC